MRKISDEEVLSLMGLLRMEKDSLVVSKAMKELIADENLKEQMEASVLATEGRVKTMQQFINENQVIGGIN